MAYLIPFLIAFALAIIVTPIVRRIALIKGYVAKPRQDRWHKKETALFGGAAIFLSFIIPYILFVKPTVENISIIVCGCLIFGLGLFDDIVQIKPYTKLMGQIIVASLVMSFGISIKIIPYQIISIPLSILWIVGIMNAFNLLDNMDALSAGIAAIAGLTLFLFSFLDGNAAVGLPALILAGSLLGFLRYNFNPAQIFMGDCGSMFIGFILATITLLGSWRESTHLISIMAVPIMVLAVPILDTLFVTFMRGMNSRKIFQGGRDHMSHRMVVLGLSERNSVLVLYVISIIFGAISVGSMFVNPLVTMILVLLVAIGLMYFAAFLGKVKMYEAQDVVNLKKKNGNVVLNNILLHKRRTFEVGVDFILICIAYISAYLLRFEGVLSEQNQSLIVKSLPVIVVIKYIILFKFGLYRGIWRYVSILDLVNILKAVSFASLVSALTVLLIWRFEGFSRAVFVIDWILLFVLVSGSRVVERIYKEIFDQSSMKGKRVLIYGAGDAGEFILREMRNNKVLNYEPVGFLDDDEEKLGRRIHGISVFGSRKDIERIVKCKGVDEVIIAIPSLEQVILEEVISFCRSVDISYRKISEILPRQHIAS